MAQSNSNKVEQVESDELSSIQKVYIKSSVVKSAAFVMLALSMLAIIPNISQRHYPYIATWLTIIGLNLWVLAVVNRNVNKAAILFMCSLMFPSFAVNIFEKGAIASTYLAVPAIAAGMVALTRLRWGILVSSLYTLSFIAAAVFFSVYQREAFQSIFLGSVENIVLYMSNTLLVSSYLTCGIVAIVKQSFIKLQTDLVNEKNEAQELRDQVSQSLEKKSSFLDTVIHMQQIGKVYGHFYNPSTDEFFQLTPGRSEFECKALEEADQEHLETYGRRSQVIAQIRQSLEDKQDWSSIIEANDVDGNPLVLQVQGELTVVNDKTVNDEMVNDKAVNAEIEKVVVVVRDITDIKDLEKDLAKSQKLEAVGQLAAGIAHEINTPAQFVSDNLGFIKEGVDEFCALISNIDTKCKDASDNQLAESIKEDIANSEFDYFYEELPDATRQSIEGMHRVAKIVLAMKAYIHQSNTTQPADINAAINSTLILSTNEWKYIANLETDFEAGLPEVDCVVSEINQVVLNLIVNSAHALEEKFDGSLHEKVEGSLQEKVEDSERGKLTEKATIRIGTKLLNHNEIEIFVEDNGCGIPESTIDKAFDPFYTTKSLGKGSGQGLSLVHNIISNHNGELSVESVEGVGTTFRIRLPVKHSDAKQSQEYKRSA